MSAAKIGAAPLLTYFEAAEYLNVSHWTVRRLRAEGLIQPARIGSQTIRFTQAALDAYVAQVTVPASRTRRRK